MAKPVIMPKTGMAMEEGVLIGWLKKEGEFVEKGDPIAEIETDKAVMELEADYSGTLIKVIGVEGSTIPVTEVIAWIGEPDEEISDSADPSAASEPVEVNVKDSTEKIVSYTDEATCDGKIIKATPAARRVAAERNIPLSSVRASGRSGEIRENDVISASAVRATPLASRMMADRNISPSDIGGSGYSGKIFSTDIPSPDSTAGRQVLYQEEAFKHVPLTGIQKITGKKMLESHLTIPPVTQNIKADVTELMNMRIALNNAGDVKFSVNDFILMAVVKTLKEYPRLNSEFNENDLIYKNNINLGVAVASPRGLLVPVVHKAENYSLKDLSSIVKNLAEQGRDGKLSLDKLTGGTFTVSNLGMYGICSFTPIINPPEAGILGVCSIEDCLKLNDNGEVENRKVMELCLTYDHRIVDGAEAAMFLRRLKEYLTTPPMILV